MEEEIKKFNEIHNLIIKFEPNYEGEFEDLIDKSKKIGNIYSEENEGRDEKEVKEDVLNYLSPEFKRDSGFLIPVYEDGKYKGMLWVSEEDIGNHIDLDLIKG